MHLKKGRSAGKVTYYPTSRVIVTSRPKISFWPDGSASPGNYGWLFVLAQWYYINKYTCWPPLWSSGQSSWLKIQRSGFDSRRYQIFWEVVGLEWDPLSLMSTNEELLERKSSSSGLENREYNHRECHADHMAPSICKRLALTSPTSSGRSQTQAME
jgi:hypothetical protein